MHRLFFLLSAPVFAQVCDPAKLMGPYGFQLSGTTTISGAEKPTTSLGRIVFDGHGNLSGTSSAMFSGFFLGNPVTGAYEAHTDCTLTWKLQDDSGAFQNFGGTISSDLMHAQFRQTDPGGAQRGILQRVPDTCTSQSLAKRYQYTVAGSTTPMQDGDTARTVSAKGTIDVARSGTFQVDSDCIVEFDVLLVGPDQRLVSLHMRGILVNGGREILAIQTDPGAMVAGRFIADSKSSN
jgi:hypothetical protein